MRFTTKTHEINNSTKLLRFGGPNYIVWKPFLLRYISKCLSIINPVVWNRILNFITFATIQSDSAKYWFFLFLIFSKTRDSGKGSE
jgi:hypothetical protein